MSEIVSIDDKIGLLPFLRGIEQDLRDLREGRISVADAQARAALAKQWVGGVKQVIKVQQVTMALARDVTGSADEGARAP